MPEYAYKCRTCTHEFNVKKSISQASCEEPCPACGGDTRKVWSAPSVRGAGVGTSSVGAGSACGTTGGG